jgi:hypothetical protein
LFRYWCCSADVTCVCGSGPLRLDGIHYATSHSLTGSLYQLSCGTVGGDLFLTLHFPWPIVTRQTAAVFADALDAVLATVLEAEEEVHNAPAAA